MLIFVSIMKELDLIILIMTPTTSTLPYLAFQYQNGNSPQASNCVAIVMFSNRVPGVRDSKPLRQSGSGQEHGRLTERELRGDDEHEQDRIKEYR